MDSVKSAFLALQFRDLRLFLLGSFISFAGSYMQIVGVAWHTYALTHSPFFLGILGVLGLIPTIIGFLPAGVIVDKFHKKHVLIVTEIIQTIIVLLLFATTQLHLISIWILFGLIFLMQLVNSIETPAKLATVPLIVTPQYVSQALALNTLSRQIGAVVGPGLAGFCIALYGVQSIYLLNGLSYLFLGIMVMLITIPKVFEHVAITKELVLEGFHFIKDNRVIGITMLLDFFATFFAGAMVLLPVFAKVIYHANAQELGLLYAAPSLGSIVAGIYFSSKKHISNQGKVLLFSVIAYGLGTIGFGLSSWFLLGFIFLAVAGAGDMVSTVVRNIIRQELTPDRLRGRVMSVLMVFFLGGPYLGDAEAGFVAGFFGAPFSVVAGGALTILLTALVAWKVPSLRTYEGIKH